ncbi:MAG: hypothetical protein GXY83_24400 [Rhodopirellula sp.]|nr:hypothetical protein [Rhodopirellula sp.]
MTATCIEPLALYRPRDPQGSDLWRLIDEHFATFQQVYDDRYQAKYGFWRPVVEHSATAFLKCGDLHEGFARVRCPDCDHEKFVIYMTRCPFSLSRLVEVTSSALGGLQGGEGRLPAVSRSGRRGPGARGEAELSDPLAAGFPHRSSRSTFRPRARIWFHDEDRQELTYVDESTFWATIGFCPLTCGHRTVRSHGRIRR